MPMNHRLMRPRQQGIAASLLLHFDGENNATNTTDASPNNLEVTFNGGAQISATEKKFGSGAAYFDGDGDYLTVDSDESLSFGTGDFTIEFWAYFLNPPSNTPAWLGNCESWQNGAFTIRYDQTTDGYEQQITVYWRWDSDDLNNYMASGVLDYNEWRHVAVVRNGTSLKLYVNGSESGSRTIASGRELDLALGGQFLLGTHWDGNGNDYIDDLRIVKGLAVYTGNFTPPTGPLSVSATRIPPIA